MNNYTGFTDLCIPVTDTDKLVAIIQEAIELGYRNLAIEKKFNASAQDVGNKKDPVPKPTRLTELRARFGGQIRLLNRLTVIFSENTISMVLNKSSTIIEYDVIAVQPTTDDSLAYACQNVVCDIITYEVDKKVQSLNVNRKLYYMAIERNVAFEIKYAPAIVNSLHRIDTIAQAHYYHSTGKSKNLLISSAATNAFELRSPYDIANLGLIFGLSEEQSKQAIRDVPNRLLHLAQARRFGKAGVDIFRRRRKDNAVDSDDYSDSELNEEISDDDDGKSDRGNSEGLNEPMEVTMGSKNEDVDELMEMADYPGTV
ncbi:ribonuclease P protein subunit p30 [Anopheles ziemanni]|uniref:ribonuclease P protein subunit p30 n=1 Tax=Anopheles ziemanni TaxID=345580 RepID=UPI00265D6873|nr:ribonuclease P protein subunit p30 [Anopheles ziemanni]